MFSELKDKYVHRPHKTWNKREQGRDGTIMQMFLAALAIMLLATLSIPRTV
jgi:hypothetical protein